MARLRVNGVSGLIGPNQISLTTSTTTTVSWAVAPGFATLTGSDYYPIIVNPNTTVQEIIYVTAYTSGATSGTCLRAQEGTSGAAYTGTNWVHGPTAYDFSATHVVTQTSTYSANSGDSVMVPSGTFTVTLPPPFINALVKVTNYGSGVVTVSHNASEVIYGLGCGSSGQTTISLGAYGATATLESDGTSWYITAGLSGVSVSASWPVNSVFIGYTATNPYTLLGVGTSTSSWVQIAQGQMLVGQSTGDANFGTLGNTGGAVTTTLSTANLASHTHGWGNSSNTENGSHYHTGTTGDDSSQPHNHSDAMFDNGGYTMATGSGAHHIQDGGTGTQSSYHTHSFSTGTESGSHYHTGTTDNGTGSSTAFSILSPFLTVYIWRRVS